MAGTFADQAALAADDVFVAQVKVAMIFRATELYGSATAQTFQALEQSRRILRNAGSESDKIAALVATGNATIAAASPAVPSDGDTQFAVNTVLTDLLK